MRERLRLFVLSVAALIALAFIACDDEDSDYDIENNTDETSDNERDLEDTDPGEETGDDVDETDEPEDTALDTPSQFTISGSVKRSGTAKVIGDGIGTLCVAVTHSCPSGSNANPKKLGDGVVIKDADFSANGATVSYSMTVNTSEAEIDKQYFLSAVMKEDGSDCIPVPGEPILRAGDMVGMNCGRFKFQGTDVENVNVTLDWTLEFDI